ncbi:MAG: hypothetical protein FWG84_02050 [Bacteroidales bacterium]|nr:hypothetical protein [Bacteroidales bacterium]
MKANLYIILMVLLLPRMMQGQCTPCISSQERPDWVNGYNCDLDNSTIRNFQASASTEDDARNKALNLVITGSDLGTGGRYKIDPNNSGLITVVSGNNELTVKARVRDEYCERCGAGNYTVHLLVQTAHNPTYDFEKVNVNDKYPFSPRVFVPGMAQLHKGSTTKGVLFIVGEVVFVGGIVACEGLRSSYESKINTTHDPTDRQNYIDNADLMQNLRNGFIAGAAALYVWNVIDGIAAKGKKHVMVVGNSHLCVAPYISPYSNGVMLSLKF